MERPTGVTILAVFEFFIATLLILFALASALGVSALGAILARTRDLGSPGFAIFAGAGIIVASILLMPAFGFVCSVSARGSSGTGHGLQPSS